MGALKMLKKSTSNGTNYTVAVISQPKQVPPAKYTPKMKKVSAKKK